ncbi:hypothetical protein STRCI_008535 [Streptomyces cinnabarinus]|uniref:SMI1/KNR4 family protein n=1 Tax=Streptomyces cinnabarinus TaxID=67287 RepID=A0ABY7KS87_9ACTN|nr:hypothetical protein [Streptomyces cinnabarinus]WAZ26873.1 hypothetical protein STRCI_008535 [Streptomyces cinnabarinus]
MSKGDGTAAVGGPGEASSTVEIGGLALPKPLADAIEDGSWTRPKDAEVLRRVFGDEPDGPMFYDLPSMTRQNRSFQQSALQDVFGDASATSLGVSPRQAVLIGDLGAEMPIALDYREHAESPRVIYLGPEGWIEVTPRIDMLLDLLHGQG